MIIKDRMEIQVLQSYTQAQFEDLKQLLSELSDRVNFTQTDLMLVLKDSNCHMYVILDGEEERTIVQMKRGAVGKLLGKSDAEISRSAPRQEVAGEASGSRKAVQTAASRGSNADDDDDVWEEDD